jgi:peroxiredoxin
MGSDFVFEAAGKSVQVVPKVKALGHATTVLEEVQKLGSV